MTLLAAFSQRIRSEETTQLLALLLALLSLVLIVSWPTATSPVNNSWESVSLVRRGALAACALLWGLGSRHVTARARLLSALLLITFALLSAPFEVAALAASVPLVPLPLALLFGVAAPLALYGLTLLLVTACRRIRLGWLALPFVLLSLGGLVYADLLLDVQLFSPLQELDGSAWPHALLNVAAAVLTLALLILAERQTDSRTRAAAGSAA
jgi:hypothetical protein